MATLSEFVSVLYQSRTQAQIWHHQTQGVGSYAEHKALDHYYSSIIDKVDGLVESIQGVKGRVGGYTTKPLVDWKEGQSVAYFKSLYEYIATERAGLGSESWIQNQVDEVAELVANTLYQLSLK